MVQEEIYDEFVKKLAEEMKKQLKVGDGFDPKTTQGPLINSRAVDKVSRLVEDSRAKGGQILLGGKHLSGNFYEPTLITDINENMEIAREEIFGPVAAIMK